jgi:DNA mismatch endonuclease (patch repair protein)
MKSSTTRTRSEIMGQIRAGNTTPERVLRSALWARGVRYRLHPGNLLGRPDVAIARAKVAVFVDGCFWHGCPRHYVRPRTRAEFWGEKLSSNVGRDRQQTLELEANGWRVLRFWECEVLERTADCAREILLAIRAPAPRPKPAPRLVRVVPVCDAGSVERRFLVDLRSEEIIRVEERRRTTHKVRAAEHQKMVRARARRSGSHRATVS